jgi:hypothetical protein
MAEPLTSFPNTAHSVFYAYSIVTGSGAPIGSFEKFGSSFTRTHERIREIMNSRGPITKEIIWGGTDIQVTLTKVELYDQAMLQALGMEIFTIEDFNQVIDVVEYMYIPDQPGSPQQLGSYPGGGGKRVITYQDCVPTNATKDVDTTTAKVAENMTLECRTVRGTFE